MKYKTLNERLIEEYKKVNPVVFEIRFNKNGYIENNAWREIKSNLAKKVDELRRLKKAVVSKGLLGESVYLALMVKENNIYIRKYLIRLSYHAPHNYMEKMAFNDSVVNYFIIDMLNQTDNEAIVKARKRISGITSDEYIEIFDEKIKHENVVKEYEEKFSNT